LYHVEISDVEEYRDLEMQARGHSLCEFVHDLCISDIYRPGTILLPLTV